MQHPLYKIILCDFINPVGDKKARLQRDGAIVLIRGKDQGECAYKIVETGACKEILPKYSNKRSIEILEMNGKMALPGFFDMHFHWVQDAVCLMPKDSLLKWLSDYTWPYEAKFKARGFSSRKSREFAEKLLSVGTVGGACYSSVHSHAVDDAFRYFLGDFVIGNVLMTENSPRTLIQSEKEALSLVSKKAKKYRQRYALTPRFAITVSPEIMKKTASIARKYGTFIQTHLSETKKEIKTVLDIFNGCSDFQTVETYTEVYYKCRILGPKTIVGHAIHLCDSEFDILQKTNTSIAHCPTSNAPVRELGLGSGLFDFRKIEKKGIRWALATDIGGGPYLSMFDVMHSFVKQNRKKGIMEATYTKALSRATISGAGILGLHKTHGSLANGKFANIIFVESPGLKKGENAECVLERLLGQRGRKRSDCDNMVLNTIYKGHQVYFRD